MTGRPLIPNQPVKDELLSTKTGIAFYWDSVADNAGQSGGRVTGYRAYMAKDTDGSHVQIFDGKDFRTIVSYLAEGLDTGRFYRFKVSAYNFNGEGDTSDELTTYACVSPSRMVQPTRVTSTPTSFTLEWYEPDDNGGCPITGYAVFRNDGENGAIGSEVNTASDTNVRDKPTLRQLVITDYPINAIGKTFMY
jgi:hypothetical protein